MWKSISGFEGHYEINELGQIRSLTRIVTHKNGRQFLIKGKLLTMGLSKKGYVRVNLSLQATPNFFFVHQLVAQSFILNPECKPQVNHKNCIKTDNRIDNLEWVTNEENYNHAKENGRMKKDKELSYTILHKALVPEILMLLKTNKTIDVAKVYGVTERAITNCLRKNIPRSSWPSRKGGWKSFNIGDPSIKEIVVVKP
jgi:hypothetical protein